MTPEVRRHIERMSCDQRRSMIWAAAWSSRAGSSIGNETIPATVVTGLHIEQDAEEPELQLEKGSPENAQLPLAPEADGQGVLREMVPTELVLGEQGSKGGVVELDPGYDLSEPVFLQLTETRQDNYWADHYLINNQDLEQELTQAVYIQIGDFWPPPVYQQITLFMIMSSWLLAKLQ